MRVLRRIWRVSLVLAVLSLGAQGVASAACLDPAFMTVNNGPGNTLSSSVQSPDQNEWTGWVTMTVQVDGQSYKFSIPASAPSGGGFRQYLLSFGGTVTVQSYEACLDPSGMTESPEPVAVAEVPD